MCDIGVRSRISSWVGSCDVGSVERLLQTPFWTGSTALFSLRILRIGSCPCISVLACWSVIVDLMFGGLRYSRRLLGPAQLRLPRFPAILSVSWSCPQLLGLALTSGSPADSFMARVPQYPLVADPLTTSMQLCPPSFLWSFISFLFFLSAYRTAV